MAVQVNLKRWGNSLAVIVPSKIIEEKNLKENDAIFVEVVKKADLSKIFGTIKKRKMTGQEFKDMVREGWSK
ncbi:MAG: AbrB/MazE/SpoVT family DNA-binding domain-containing protein [Nanoarchaeota archaeon]